MKNIEGRKLINSWLRSIDYLLFFSILLLLILSLVLISSAGPVIAKRILLPQNYFIYRHIIYSTMSLGIMVIFSFVNQESLYKISFVGLVVCTFLLIVVLINGLEIKGAKRWLYFFRVSVQPSEFVKPFFTVVIAWILSRNFSYKYCLSFIVYFFILVLFLLQPDFSMSIILTTIWLGQLFIYGMPYIWFIIAGIIFIILLIIIYNFIPYIKHRIDVFFDPYNHDNFQIGKSIKAFKMGKFTGIGPGEGNIKFLLPDCHTDFIFAVAAEEFGAILCLVILLLFGFIIYRIWLIAYNEKRLFNLLVVSGLLIQFTAQFLINIGVVLNLIPTTGLALPLLSYGGSSLLSISIVLGIILSFSKNRIVSKRIII